MKNQIQLYNLLPQLNVYYLGHHEGHGLKHTRLGEKSQRDRRPEDAPLRSVCSGQAQVRIYGLPSTWHNGSSIRYCTLRIILKRYIYNLRNFQWIFLGDDHSTCFYFRKQKYILFFLAEKTNNYVFLCLPF